MDMTPSPRCKALIERFEGCKLAAYPDPGSPMGQGKYSKDGPDVSKGAPWTIGFGATGPGITRGTVWTMEQAERQFDEHIAQFGAGVSRLLTQCVNRPTSQNMYDSLVSLAYNIGLSRLEHSTLFAAHCAGRYLEAKGQFALWDKAGGKKLAGLTKRRAAEAEMYGTS